MNRSIFISISLVLLVMVLSCRKNAALKSEIVGKWAVAEQLYSQKFGEELADIVNASEAMQVAKLRRMEFQADHTFKQHQLNNKDQDNSFTGKWNISGDRILAISRDSAKKPVRYKIVQMHDDSLTMDMEGGLIRIRLRRIE